MKVWGVGGVIGRVDDLSTTYLSIYLVELSSLFSLFFSM